MLPSLYVPISLAEENVQDMSDPLAVFTQVGVGATDKGLNLKIGKSYDTGEDNLAGMNVFEVKGFLGDVTGFNSDEDLLDNSVDSLRYRNFEVNLTNGRAFQVDVNYDVGNEAGTASYSFIQALPKLGPLSFYPLAGAGVAFGNTILDDGRKVGGYTIPGTFAVVGAYSKLELTEDIWFNYNPMWTSTLSGSDEYQNQAMEGDDNVLNHEISLSYQVNPKFNVRYFANWSENNAFEDGGHRIEFNYQL
ncbi:hypothetical protein L4C33_11560 [Vibrio makurazakiensis]